MDRFDLIQPTHAVGKFHDEWPRFSLRALMLAISLACILLASMRSEAGHTLATFVLTITIGVPITLVLVEIETWILTAIVNCMQSKARSTIASHLDPLRDTS